MRFLVINYFPQSQNHKYKRFISKFNKEFFKIFKHNDTDVNIIQINNFKELYQYAYRNKQNFSNSIEKRLNNFKIIDIVIIGSYYINFNNKLLNMIKDYFYIFLNLINLLINFF